MLLSRVHAAGCARRAGARVAPALARAFSAAVPARGDKEKLIIFDTTLRDGEQSPGATLTGKEKLLIARMLCRLGVDVCEAGFPIASDGDFEAVRTIAQEVGGITEGRVAPMRICGLARANEKDLDRCYDAVRHAPLNRIHTFLASSDIHLQHKLNISRAVCIERAVSAVRHARSMCDNIEFSPEDAGRSDRDFLVELLDAVIEAGATTLNIPDTVGYTVPFEYASLIAHLKAKCKGGDAIIWSTHCHNDLGLATANTLAAVQAGARQVEVTLNSLGERAGNTSLEEVVMAVRTRPNHYPYHVDIDTTQIIRASKMVALYTGIPVQPNKAIVGANAFAHEAGIHQHGVLKHAATYEIMTPESVGADSALILGKHSGKAAFKQRLIALGYPEIAQDEAQLEKLVSEFKTVADQKKHVTDADIEAILADRVANPAESDSWTFESLQLTAGTDGKDRVRATATIALVDAQGTEHVEAAIGSGPVEATFKAINRIIKIPVNLVQYNVNAVTGGKDALGGVLVHIQPRDPADAAEDGESHDGVTRSDKAKGVPTYTGHGTSTDIIVASALSYVSALNKLIALGSVANPIKVSVALNSPDRILDGKAV
ncbi:hypothetical protein KFE25_004515 [Diacronema lutheri]|uniref:2-isopropylmalate synthase n=2 Tax=Diacronema lutheri TaxID=2081491 RepID=A0A8J5XBZ9_DIALT|nr:hypothetical protein KFE25_013844 [Diacronema lutheri]KAG8458374.1 hypothetical protein KFE25_004515 [Diacronema lutheri]